MQLESLKEDSLYTVDKPLEFILVPKCPLFGDSTVYDIVSRGNLAGKSSLLSHGYFHSNYGLKSNNIGRNEIWDKFHEL